MLCYSINKVPAEAQVPGGMAGSCRDLGYEITLLSFFFFSENKKTKKKKR